jgi:hypothetical protein
MKKTILLFLLFVIIICFFTLFIPVKLYKNKIYYVNDYFDMNKKSVKKINGYYSYQSECGYFSLDDGFVNIYLAAPDQFIESNIYGYVLYNKMGDTINLFNPEGNKVLDIKNFGYPYMTGDFPFFYVIKTNGTGFFCYSMKGEEVFKPVDYTSIITSVNSDKNGDTLVSNLDGETFLYSSKGDVLFNSDTIGSDSKIKIAKSNAIDEKGQNIAICTGLNPEYIEVYQVKNGKKLTQLKTDTNFKYRSFLQFNNNRIYYESVDKLMFFDLKKNGKGFIKTVGEIDEVKFDSSGNIFIISNIDNLYFMTIYDVYGNRKFYKEFLNKIDNLRLIGDVIYFKSDDKIIRLSMKISA